MDLSKAERQTPQEDNRQSSADYLKELIQDFLFFLVLIFAAVLIGWGIFLVLDDGNEWKRMPHNRNGSKISLQKPTTEAMRPCQRARHWIQLYLIRHKTHEQEKAQQYLPTEAAEHPYPPEPVEQYYHPQIKTQVPQVEQHSKIREDSANQVDSPSSRELDLFRRHIRSRLAED
ncbi:uncharacterized protein LOC117896805 isoform X1 [Drosophila subobscura]|uniref:uncharacterized protein LOC117896805 isoform X1 n=1 Tax=Drosophila subobscura TaxID=7241 RepID=UPI00155AA1D5|nr:uncharacterized protein LOC117896805 isoform X1 [Drosophila subobscura]